MNKAMIGKETPKHYLDAVNKARDAFASRDPQTIEKLSGAEWNGELSSFIFKSIGQELQVHYPDGNVCFSGEDRIPALFWRISIVNYLGHASGIPLSNEFIPFRSLKSGMMYARNFKGMTEDRLVRKLSRQNFDEIRKAATALEGRVFDTKHFHAEFDVFPQFPMQIVLWPGDDEMEGSATVLFNSRADHYLPTEDSSYLGFVLSDILISQWQEMFNY